ncbi:MAG: hypothetical protein AB3N14_01305 [Flavobacteriaceae bacterium]
MSDTDKLDLQDKLIAFKSVLKVIGAPLAAAVTGDPFVAAGVTNLFLETFFGIQSEVKMKRVNMFFIKLEKGIQEIDKDFDLDKADKVELRDLIETAMLKSSRATTEGKIERLKKVIIGQIKYVDQYDYVTRYLDLAEKLNDKQVIILAKYVETEKEFIVIQEEIARIYEQKEDAEKTYSLMRAAYQENDLRKGKPSKKQLEAMKKGMVRIEGEILEKQNDYNRIRRVRNQQFNILGEHEFNFLLNDLRVMGLIYNPSEGRASDTGEYSGYRCTPLATGFIKFLE